MRSRRAARKRALRERIYAAAIECFRAYGFEETTMEEIADGADVARATIFNHFGTKEALLLEYRGRLQSELESAEAHLLRAAAGARLAQDGVYAFFDALANIAEREGHLFRTLVRETSGRHLPVSRADEYHAGTVVNLLAAALSAGRSTGELRNDVDPQVTAMALARLWTAVLLDWSASEGNIPLAGEVQRMADLVLRGARSRG